jgi:guanylate kinase
MDSTEIMDIILNNQDQIKKYTEFYLNYVNHPYLYKLHEILLNKEKLSNDFIDKFIEQAKKDQKLYQWVEVLLTF